MAFGDLLTARGLAIALTLLGSAIVAIAIGIGPGRIMGRWPSGRGARMQVLASFAGLHSAVGFIQSLVVR